MLKDVFEAGSIQKCCLFTENDEARRTATGAFGGNDAMYAAIPLSLLATIYQNCSKFCSALQTDLYTSEVSKFCLITCDVLLYVFNTTTAYKIRYVSKL